MVNPQRWTGVNTAFHTLAAPGTPKAMAKKRTHFIAVQLDGAYRLKALVPLLKRLVEECKKDKAVGIGLVSMLGFEDSAKTLKVPLVSMYCSKCTEETLGFRFRAWTEEYM